MRQKDPNNFPSKDATDTYNADALLKEFDVHYQINTIGSDEEFVK